LLRQAIMEKVKIKSSWDVFSNNTFVDMNVLITVIALFLRWRNWNWKSNSISIL